MATQSTPTNITARGDVIDLKEEHFKAETLTQTALRRLRKDYLTLLAMGTVALLALMAIAAPVFAKALNVDPNTTNANRKFGAINMVFTDSRTGEVSRHLLGTDNLGRDTFSRLLYGGRVSLRIAFMAALASTTIGVTIGLIAGFYQGGSLRFIDDGLIWFITTLNSIPTLMLLILLASVLTPSINTLILVLVIVNWTGTMRLIRGETLAQRENEYIVSARAMGASPLRIMWVHILPNTLSVLVTALAIEIGSLILTEAALSFLGLGVRPPDASWGNMLTGAQAYFRQGVHQVIIPGVLISVTVLCFYLIGDGLRDALDPRSTK